MTTKSQPSRNVLMGIVWIALTFLFATSLFSCIDEPTTPPDGEGNMITLSLTTPKSFTPTTYAADGVNEDKIQTVDVLIFDDQGNYFSGPHYGAVGATFVDETDLDNIKTYTPVTLRIPEGATTGFTMAVFANSRKIINGASFLTNEDKATTLQRIVLDDDGTNQWETFTDAGKTYNLIPMHSELNVTDAINGTNNKISLKRMVARVNVEVALGGFATFTLSSVHFGNYNTKGYVAEGAVTALTNLPGDFGPSSTLVSYPVDGNTCENKIYTFEAAGGNKNSTSTNPCIIIGGEYDGDGAGGQYSAGTYYYRVDFVNESGTYLDIKRNYSYNFTINKIDGPGYATPELAYASRPVNVKYDIAAWNESEVVDASYNGQHKIATSAAQLSFDSSAKTATNGDNILFIETSNPGGWTASIVDDGTNWLSLQDMDGSTAVTSSAHLKSPYDFAAGKSCPVKLIMDANIGGAPRTAYIKIKAGNVYYSVKVTQSHLANSNDVFKAESSSYTFYTAPFNDNFFIPVSIANGASTIKLNSGDAFTATVTGNGIKKVAPFGVGSDGHVYVEPGTEGGTSTVSIYKKNESGDDVLVHSWTMNVIKPVVETRESNCYIVPPNSAIVFPVSIANKTGTDVLGTQLNNGDTFTAGLVWTDNSNGVSENSNIAVISPYITGQDAGQLFVGTGDKEGNAVVAIKNTAGTILWSWHIWVTGYDPNQSEGQKGTAVIDPTRAFMDRNLGAFNNGNPSDISPWTAVNAQTFGLVYQWGRKDPFPGSYGVHPSFPTNTSGVEPTIYYGPFGTTGKGVGSQQYSITTQSADDKSGAQSFSYVIQNPDKFITNSGDWCSDNANGNLTTSSTRWGTINSGGTAYGDDKSVYDPCPPGWRVPRNGSWNNSKDTDGGTDGGRSKWLFQVTSNSQRNDTQGGVYPAAGFRFYSHGSLVNVGTYGAYWSASSSSATAANGRSLYIYGSAVDPSIGNTRACGYAVRCVQEISAT